MEFTLFVVGYRKHILFCGTRGECENLVPHRPIVQSPRPNGSILKVIIGAVKPWPGAAISVDEEGSIDFIGAPAPDPNGALLSLSGDKSGVWHSFADEPIDEKNIALCTTHASLNLLSIDRVVKRPVVLRRNRPGILCFNNALSYFRMHMGLYALGDAIGFTMHPTSSSLERMSHLSPWTPLYDHVFLKFMENSFVHGESFDMIVHGDETIESRNVYGADCTVSVCEENGTRRLRIVPGEDLFLRGSRAKMGDLSPPVFRDPGALQLGMFLPVRALHGIVFGYLGQVYS